jgi:hypothetical protein
LFGMNIFCRDIKILCLNTLLKCGNLLEDTEVIIIFDFDGSLLKLPNLPCLSFTAL